MTLRSKYRIGDGKRAQAGLTLLELIVALAIIALALVAIGPNFTGAADRASLEQTAKKITAELIDARAAAIRRNEPFTFAIDLEGRTYAASHRQAQKTYADNIEVRVVSARSELIGDNRPVIRFWPDGSSTGGEINLMRQNRAYRITVDWLTGSVDVERSDNETD
jgi:general secretion pathway protein H